MQNLYVDDKLKMDPQTIAKLLKCSQWIFSDMKKERIGLIVDFASLFNDVTPENSTTIL